MGCDNLAVYSYVAIDKTGKESKGTVNASAKEQVINIIKSEGKIPVSISEVSKMGNRIELSALKKKPKPRDMAIFCRQFVSISSAGVPVTAALEMLTEQTENKLLSNAINECRIDIQSGTSFSEAMTQHPNVFPDLLITMVEAGEATGSLETSFGRMAEQFEKEAKLKGLVRKASVYPITIILVSIVVVMILLGYVIPQFESMLTDMGSELPMITLIVIAASEFVQSSWYYIILVLGGLAYFLHSWGKTDSGRRVFGRIQLRLPLFGKLAVKTASARMSRTLSTLIAAGIPLIDCIGIVANTMTNIYYRDALIESKEEVAMGTPLSESLTKSGVFPPLVCHMTKIGEEVGDMEGMLNKQADYFDEEVEVATGALMAALEPAIIVVLALIVGTIVMSVMFPMAEMYAGLEGM